LITLVIQNVSSWHPVPRLSTWRGSP
jgi:hypothetical protein